MSDGGREPIYGGDDWRTGDAPHEHEAVYDFFVDLIRGGLAQVAFLGAPALWIVAGTPVYTVEIATAAGSALVVLGLLITTFRGGHFSVGRPWPVLTNRRLGTTGWRAFLTRSVYLSSTLLVVVFGGVLAQAAGGSSLANVLVAGALSVAALVALPYLSASTPRARIGRFCYCVLGLLPPVVVALTGTDPTGVLAAVTVLALAAVDTRPIAAMRGR
ncbi:hypothetical protein [Halalkalicoccus sp. NIPERK01]|uniref:hypothetical protein n=1 Tax=Halalkalicoccus sp. NIPERK01 TaxID=3053469 RepID=UPI00256F1809|nr:hypothetical protein [Halalkalicoccus sp. NIPERK01]MDL5362426.1 hypothetical protein [Halalkalicoccus sp. NIPERK01]